MIVSTAQSEFNTLIVRAVARSLRAFLYHASGVSMTEAFTELLPSDIINLSVAHRNDHYVVAALTTRHISVHYVSSDNIVSAYTICHADMSICDNAISSSACIAWSDTCHVFTDTKYFNIKDQSELQYSNVKLDNGKSFHPINKDVCEITAVYTLLSQLFVVVAKSVCHNKHVVRWLRWDSVDNSFVALLEVHIASSFACCSEKDIFFLHTGTSLRGYNRLSLIVNFPLDIRLTSLGSISENALIGCDCSGNYWLIDTASCSSRRINLTPCHGPSFVPYANQLYIISSNPIVVLVSHPQFGCQMLISDDTTAADLSLSYFAMKHLDRVHNATSLITSVTQDDVLSPVHMMVACSDANRSQLSQCLIGYTHRLVEEQLVEIPASSSYHLHVATLAQLSLLSLRQYSNLRNIVFDTTSLTRISLDSTDVPDDNIILWDAVTANCVVCVTPNQIILLQSTTLKKIKNILSVLTLKLLKFPPRYSIEHASVAESYIVLTSHDVVKVVLYHEMSGLHVAASISMNCDIRDISTSMWNNRCYISTLFWTAETPQVLEYTSGAKDIHATPILANKDPCIMKLLVLESHLVLVSAVGSCIKIACYASISECTHDRTLNMSSQVHFLCICDKNNSTRGIIVSCADGVYIVFISSASEFSIRCVRLLLPPITNIQVLGNHSGLNCMWINAKEYSDTIMLSVCCGVVDTSTQNTILQRSQSLSRPIYKLVNCDGYTAVLHFDAILQKCIVEMYDDSLTCLWTSDDMQSIVAPCCVAGPISNHYSCKHQSLGVFTLSLCHSGGSHVITFARCGKVWNIISVLPIVGRVSGLYFACHTTIAVTYDHFLQLLRCSEGYAVDFTLHSAVPIVVEDQEVIIRDLSYSAEHVVVVHDAGIAVFEHCDFALSPVALSLAYSPHQPLLLAHHLDIPTGQLSCGIICIQQHRHNAHFQLLGDMSPEYHRKEASNEYDDNGVRMICYGRRNKDGKLVYFSVDESGIMCMNCHDSWIIKPKKE